MVLDCCFKRLPSTRAKEPRLRVSGAGKEHVYEAAAANTGEKNERVVREEQEASCVS